MGTAPGQPLGKLILPPAKQGAGPAPGGGGLDSSELPACLRGVPGPPQTLPALKVPRQPAAARDRAAIPHGSQQHGPLELSRHWCWQKEPQRTGPGCPGVSGPSRASVACNGQLCPQSGQMLPSDLLRGRSSLRLRPRRTENAPHLPPSPAPTCSACSRLGPGDDRAARAACRPRGPWHMYACGRRCWHEHGPCILVCSGVSSPL